MALQTSRRTTLTALALLTGLTALSAGAWGLSKWSPFTDEPPPVMWPDNVQPVADYVERATGLEFERPIRFEFVGDTAAYAARVATPNDGRPSETPEVDDAIGRALGLWAGDVSLAAAAAQYVGGAPFPSTWISDDNLVVINADDEQTELSPYANAELSLLLTQVLDDQLFHVVDRALTADTQQSYQSVLGLAVGHALWVHEAYIADLGQADTADYDRAYRERVQAYAQQITDVPPAYSALRSSGQQLGPVFVAALMEENPALVARAFATDFPEALDQLSLPTGKYLRPDPLEPITDPPTPRGGQQVYTGQVGPVGFYLLASTGFPVTDALTAADGWGNDRYTAYTLDGLVCLDWHLIADSSDDADRMEAALNGWASARPPTSKALVGRDGTNLYASVCDPGTEARQLTPTGVAISQYFGRANQMAERIDFTGKPAVAECTAVTTFGRFTFTELITPNPQLDLAAELKQIEQDCVAQSS